MIHRGLERSHYRSTGEVLVRYGVPLQKLELWCVHDAAPFPAPVEVSGERDQFWHFLHLVRWEVTFRRRRPREVLQ
jgi:hypothetical protein